MSSRFDDAEAFDTDEACQADRKASANQAPASPPDQPAYFEAMFKNSDDPWAFKTRWYEQRKRALTLASLPSARFQYGFEPGCANGELAAKLATRCDRLLASDGIDKAVHLSRERLRGHHNVAVRKAWMPQDWPNEKFDLIVLSEFLFYLKPDVIEVLAQLARATLMAGGVILACHWRHPIAGCKVNGDEVHAILERVLSLPRQCRIVEPDLRLEVWGAGPSVAQRETMY